MSLWPTHHNPDFTFIIRRLDSDLKWSRVPDTPKFSTRLAALEWALTVESLLDFDIYDEFDQRVVYASSLGGSGDDEDYNARH